MSHARRAHNRRERLRARRKLRAATWDCIRWALATFPDETLTQQAIHLTKETLELEAALATGTPEPGEAWDEFADVFMLASLIAHRARALAARSGVDLTDALAAKLGINRSRKWVRTPDGDYQHVKEPRA